MRDSAPKRNILFYGKGGVGKTSIATNLGTALVKQQNQVLLIGCSPKSNVVDVYKAAEITTILDLGRAGGVTETNIQQAIFRTPDGMVICETGGPEPGIGCGGQGITLALETLDRYQNVIAGLKDANYVIYDVIGDVVCGGFATPMRQGEGTKEVYIVTSGELMSLYSANNIVRAVNAMHEAGTTDLCIGGYIGNMRGIPREMEIMEAFSERTKVPFLTFVPRDPETFRRAEELGGTVVEMLPDNENSLLFTNLAQEIAAGCRAIKPTPFENYNELFELFMQFQTSQIRVDSQIAANYLDRIPLKVTDRPLKKVAIYGTGGIGKSTTSSNISAALVLCGERVFQVGCDPKRDSIVTLCGELKPTILEEARNSGNKVTSKLIRKLVHEAQDFNGRLFGSECGGPLPGRGCAGKGVALALRYLEQYKIAAELGISFMLYDVLGDTVCGGFANPLRLTRSVYIVTSGELATMVQAMKIAESVQAVANKGMEVGIAGVINNMRGIPGEREIVAAVFAEVGLPVTHHIPRSPLVQEAENLKRTVVQVFPDSDQAREYLTLAEKILANEQVVVPQGKLLTAREIKSIVARIEGQRALA